MTNLLSYLLTLTACAYVLAPLIRRNSTKSGVPQPGSVRRPGGTSLTELKKKLKGDISRERQKLERSAGFTCPSCGKGVNEKDKFCAECGAKLNF